MALAIVLVLTSLAIVGFLVYSCFRDGPQIWGTYHSIRNSFWHFRTLKYLPETREESESQEAVEQDIDLNEKNDCSDFMILDQAPCDQIPALSHLSSINEAASSQEANSPVKQLRLNA